MSCPVVDATTLREVAEFVALRIDDELRRADESGDKHALSWARGSADLVTTMRRDLDARPWARAEVGTYLVRTAQLYREHPEYRVWWA